MCPQDIKEKIFESLNREGETNYEEVRDRIIALVSNRVSAQKGPIPMAIGNIYDENENEQDIDAVRSSIQCRQCKGWGRRQRECPSDKGEDKGGGKETSTPWEAGYYTQMTLPTTPSVYSQ